MGKFSDYVGVIKRQTDSLREVVSVKSGVDCSKHSIAECSDVIDSLEVTSQEEARYIRPSWYPDIEDIISKAPNITKDGVTYYPVYIMLFEDSLTSNAFYRNNATITTAVNYMTGTGVNAYIFGDDIDNDINNASETTLQVGNEIIHNWHFDKFYSDDSRFGKVEWVIAYTSSLSSSIPAYVNFKNLVEAVFSKGVYSEIFSSSVSDNYSIKYIKLCKNIKMPSLLQKFAQKMYNLEEVVLDSNGSLTSSFTGCNNLKRIICNGEISINSSGSLAGLFSLEYLFIGNKFNITGSSDPALYCKRIVCDMKNISFGLGDTLIKSVELINTEAISRETFLSSTYGLKYIKMPSTLRQWATYSNTLVGCKYVELFNDFDISSVNLSGGLKSIQWLKDLCLWLKDRTGDTANTMIIGTGNLNNANSIYLTFNPNDKRDITFDGVTAETEGAMSITEFITTQLNWTLS